MNSLIWLRKLLRNLIMFEVPQEIINKLDNISKQYNFSIEVSGMLNKLIADTYEYGIGVGQEDILKEWESMF